MEKLLTIIEKKIKENSVRDNIDFAMLILAYITAEFFTLKYGSEAKNALLPGLSPLRIVMVTGITVYFAAAVFLLVRMKTDGRYAAPAQIIGTVSVTVSGCLFLIRILDVEKTIYTVIVSRSAPALIFSFITGILLLVRSEEIVNRNYGKNIRKEILSAAACLIIGALFSHYGTLSYERNFSGAFSLWVFPAVSVLIYGAASVYGKTPDRIKTAVWYLVLFSFSYAVIRTTQLAMGRYITPASAYWGQLAQSFTQGRLYIENPVGFHDLTFYNGKWYVPNPPLPALLLLPVAFILGPDAEINTTVYTAVLAAINTVLVYRMLTLAVENKLFFIGKTAVFYLTVAFSFGSDHFWLSTTGQMWFASQLVVVTFTVLAVISQLRSGNPFLSGACIAAAVFSRPNVIPLFFCILGIYFWQEKLGINKKDLQKAFCFAVKCGIPVLVSVCLLLGYNKIRFDDWFDFGYKTLEGAKKILEDVNRYGMFNIHFIPANANVMFLLLPRIDTTGVRFWFYPYIVGYSMFFMSPQLLYTFRSFKKEAWIIGSWISTVAIIIMLLMYHNTGADQIGYRYILDAAAPLLLLIGYGMRGKVDPVFKLMTFFSVGFQFIGIYWWYIGLK